MGERSGVYRVLVRKPEERRPLRRRSFRWEDSIKMYLQKVAYEAIDCIELSQDGTGGGHF